MNVTALLTRFAHHKRTGGYKRLLKELAAFDVQIDEFGNDETDRDFPRGFWDRKQASYKWIAEWRALTSGRKADLIHIMYGEEYFRFSPWLFPKTPLIATFHQPAELLEQELLRGDHGGRIAGLTHRLTRQRFERLAAAIVTNPTQKAVLARVMPAERIHIIPLGVDLPEVDPSLILGRERMGVLTVGNWLRDWETYERVACLRPNLRFTLINRNLEEHWRVRFAQTPNIRYLPGVSESELLQESLSAQVAFLPLLQLAGSNALLECLAAGLSVVMSDASADLWRVHDPVVQLFPVGDAEAGARALDGALERFGLASKAREIALAHKWSHVAQETYKLYQSIA